MKTTELRSCWECAAGKLRSRPRAGGRAAGGGHAGGGGFTGGGTSMAFTAGAGESDVGAHIGHPVDAHRGVRPGPVFAAVLPSSIAPRIRRRHVIIAGRLYPTILLSPCTRLRRRMRTAGLHRQGGGVYYYMPRLQRLLPQCSPAVLPQWVPVSAAANRIPQ